MKYDRLDVGARRRSSIALCYALKAGKRAKNFGTNRFILVVLLRAPEFSSLK
jgi:hypothetical protein